MARNKLPSEEQAATATFAPGGRPKRYGKIKKSEGPPTRLPKLGDTPESVQRFTTALAERVQDGHFPTSASKALTDVANTHLRAVNARMRREELERLDEMLAEARDLRKEGLGYEEDCKKHKKEPLLGKWLEIELPDGGKAWAHAAK